MTATTAYRTDRDPRTWAGLGLFGLAGFGAAAVGALSTAHGSAVHDGLPVWLISPVWIVLYASVAIAGWLVWRRVGVRRELSAYAVGLGLSALWAPLFFGAGQPGLALLDVVLLWLAICLTVAWFGRVSRPAALLLLPYWAWVSVVTAVNTAIWLR